MKDLKCVPEDRRAHWIDEGYGYVERELKALTAKLRSTGAVSAVEGTFTLNGSGASGLDDDGDFAVEVVEESGLAEDDLAELAAWRTFQMKTWKPELEGKVSMKQGEQITLMTLWKHVDILDWWARHEGSFPHMAILARRYLACPAAQSFQERVFSGAKFVMSLKRASLSSSMFEQLTILRHNKEWLKGQRDQAQRTNVKRIETEQ